MNGGILLNSDIPMINGAKVEFSGLKFNELSYSTGPRLITDSLDAVNPRFGCFVNTNDTNIQNVANTSGVPPYPIPISATTYTAFSANSTLISNLGTFFMRGNAEFRTRAISRQFRIKDSSGTVVYKWLDQVSDYKSTPPSASVSGTLAWYKLASDGDEINNYLTGTLLHNALIATPPTQPVTVYILDSGQDVSMIQASYNGQPVTIDYGFLPKRSAQRKFGYGFGFQF
jgi:hypothetical protein